jgi:hypothetical protein
MTVTTQTNIQRFKRQLTAIKRRQHFIGWREASIYADDLAALLKDLGTGDPNEHISSLELKIVDMLSSDTSD